MTFFLPDIADGEDKSFPLANCIRNNYRHIKKWAKKNATNCFRIYDREVRGYPLSIDFYAGKFSVQYFSPTREKTEPSVELLSDVQKALQIVFGKDFDEIYWKIRAKRKESRQYEKHDSSQEFFTVQEYGVKFKVNLRDYLDTGLFLDHRETRKLVASMSKGKKLLNLFAYTCSFSIQAAMAGASYTKSVDLSNTYTAWAKDNFRLNSLSLQNNEVIRADCLKFLEEEVNKGKEYDIIVIDPPTISRSKKMLQMFDIQLDYIPLLSKASQLLAKEGIIYFSTNSRKFLFERDLFSSYYIEEISAKTKPLDFHDPKIHRCWKLTKIENH